jgi:hypothetical protein
MTALGVAAATEAIGSEINNPANITIVTGRLMGPTPHRYDVTNSTVGVKTIRSVAAMGIVLDRSSAVPVCRTARGAGYVADRNTYPGAR